MIIAPSESDLLKKYAESSGNKVFTSVTDLEQEGQYVMPEMLDWCRERGNIIVLNNGTILTSEPGSRVIQNCKVVMLSKGIYPSKVIAATSQLMQVLLANATAAEEEQHGTLVEESVSAQQQRLRILVKEALEANASDIHIEVRPDIARIRFRKHGELYPHAEWLPKLGREVASVAFNKETDHAATHFNPLVPQNASMPLHIGDKEVRLRLASLPAHGGFDLVMRILATSHEGVATIEQLGYSKEQVSLLQKAVAMPHGAIIISGPTGSGKTTTLASCMKMVTTTRKIYTIEDPVEKVVDNVTQVPVNTEQSDRSFASMGRAALRMDPDVIILGEMRDEDTARVMVRAAITGHLVFSTLHTNTASTIATRLIDMGISPSLLSDPNLLVCLICQRLAPKLCQHCAVPVSESAAHASHLARWHKVFGIREVKKFKARGQYCQKCRGSGISDRTVVAEIIWVDEAGRRFIRNCDTLGWEQYLKAQGWTSYREQAINLMKSGICDPLDIERLVGDITVGVVDGAFNYRTTI